jgi:transposase
MSKIRFIGLDVHADTISVAIAEPDNGEVRSLGVISNQPEQIGKLIRKLGPAEHLQACYEAGPTGYGLYWQLTGLGVKCAVIAPTLTPTKPGDRVKTNRRDAEKLARCHRAGDLTPVWVPDAAHEALRDLVRGREDARQDQQRARQRLGKFLLRHSRQRPKDIKESWTQKHMAWIKSQVRFEQPASQAAFLDYVHEVEHAADRLQRVEKDIHDVVAAAPAEIQEVVQALQALRGVGKLVAVTVVAELGSLSRFPNARQLMGYSGMVSSEFSTGNHVRRGGITKTGNAHLRRVIVEAAWAYQHKPWIGGWLAKRQQGLDEETKAIAWKAQWRLCTRYKKLAARGKEKPEIVVAIGRELLGFIWAIAVRTEARVAGRTA